jgi:hypothetical protein
MISNFINMAKLVKKKKKTMKTLVPQSSKKINSEVKRILDANMKSISLEQSDIPFITSFIKSLIREQGEDTGEALPSNTDLPESNPQGRNPADFTPERNAEDFGKNLGPDTEPETFDTTGVDPEVTTQNLDQIKTWAGKLDEFANFLNDPDKSTSLHRILADSDKPGSLLRGVTRKATDSITRIAGEIEKLKEVLNSFIITAPKKARDAAQTTGPLG